LHAAIERVSCFDLAETSFWKFSGGVPYKLAGEDGRRRLFYASAMLFTDVLTSTSSIFEYKKKEVDGFSMQTGL